MKRFLMGFVIVFCYFLAAAGVLGFFITPGAGKVEGLVFFIPLAALLIYQQTVRARMRLAHAEFLKRNQDILEQIASLTSLPVITPAGMVLGPSETCYFQSTASAMTPQTTNVQRGGYLGTSIPLGETGLAINLGKLQSTSIPVTQFQSIGQGSVYVSNHRILFIGPHQSVAIDLPSIVNIRSFEDGVQIDSADRKPWIFKTGNVKIAAIVYRAIHG